MPSHYSALEINEIAKSVLDQYPPPLLQHHYSTFIWQGVGLPDAWNIRSVEEEKLKTALASGSQAALKTAADDIRRWGFGAGIPAALNQSPEFWDDLAIALKAFADVDTRDLLDCVPSLTSLLAHKGLGIATVSKWVCFVDQNRYAIFDSRVSIALRNVTTEHGQRAFPIVGRRPTRGRQAWPANNEVLNTPTRMARCYVDYLRVIESVSKAVQPLSTAQVEMALFMAGDVWPPRLSQLQPLIRGMWV